VENRLTKTHSSEVTLKKQVEKDKIDKISSFSLSGVYYSRDNTRVYPYNDLLSSVIGFTASDGGGQAGLELYYDKYLKGVDGEILYESDIVGIELEQKTPTYIPATDGLNIKLTIDYDVQALCDSAMEKAYQIHEAKQTAMLVLDPSNGEILGVSVKPSQNLNEIDRDNVEELFKNTRNTLFCDVYEPGSTFKILTSVANIEEYLKGNKSAYSINHVYNSSRYRYVDGQRVKCWSNH
jgi:stage V sporulation protein D (sporulation-specific penicillin-binding protein)